VSSSWPRWITSSLASVLNASTPRFHDLREPLQLHHAIGGPITLLGVALLQEPLMAPAVVRVTA
jgi:hypothetical protein